MRVVIGFALTALLTGCAAVNESESDPTLAQDWIEVPRREAQR